MVDYKQYCPIAKATEVLGERWSLLIVRELLVGADRFNEIAAGLPGLSRSLLSTRLRQLTDAGLVARSDGRYQLTPAGEDLAPLIFGLGHWAQTWILTDPRPEELDPTLLVWWAHARIRTEHLPDRRVVVEVRFSDHPNHYWLVIEQVGTSVCDYDPGFGVDAVMSTDLVTLHRVWNGREDFSLALRADRIRLDGIPAITRRLPKAFAITTLGQLADRARGVHASVS